MKNIISFFLKKKILYIKIIKLLKKNLHLFYVYFFLFIF